MTAKASPEEVIWKVFSALPNLFYHTIMGGKLALFLYSPPPYFADGKSKAQKGYAVASI